VACNIVVQPDVGACIDYRIYVLPASATKRNRLALCFAAPCAAALQQPLLQLRAWLQLHASGASRGLASLSATVHCGQLVADHFKVLVSEIDLHSALPRRTDTNE
jgi:hypothetical protein